MLFYFPSIAFFSFFWFFHYKTSSWSSSVVSEFSFLLWFLNIIKLIGIDYVGVGSDYDGLDCLPKDWNDCRDHFKIAERLESRGYNQVEIEKVMGKNILRVLEEINY